MTKLMVMLSDLNIEDINADAFLYGIKDMSVNMPNYYEVDELVKIGTYLNDNNKELFISLNKNMHNSDLNKLENILKQLSKLKIAGILYYDAAVLRLVKKLEIDIPLVWSAEHLTTNYATINFWQKYGVSHAYISSEITKDEILEIRKNTNMKMLLNVLGFLPMFVSERHLLNNYFEKFNIKKETDLYFMKKENKMYPIIDNKLGTNIYSSHFLNAYKEYLEFINHNIDYVILNSFLIDNNTFKSIVDIFKNQDIDGEDKINKLLEGNIDKGFLYQETIYRVKK